MTALGSTILSLSSFAVTLTLSRDTAATTENSAPAGFQHLVQPQAWLKLDCPLIETTTLRSAHLHCSVPPAKLGAAAGPTPLSTDGWIETAMVSSSSREGLSKIFLFSDAVTFARWLFDHLVRAEA